jgi:hypothetical protein
MKLKIDKQGKTPLPKDVCHSVGFSAIPEEVHDHHTIPYCDVSSLMTLARTNKTYWQWLLPELERRFSELAVKVIASYYCTVVFTESGLYACGNNHYGQLGLGDFKARTKFTPFTALPEALKQQGTQYQQCQQLISLHRHGFFSSTSSRKAPEEDTRSARSRCTIS